MPAPEPTKAAEALAPQERSGEGAVQRAQTEQELSAGDYAAGPATSDQVRQVGNKAFVLRGGMWIDTGFDPATMKVEEIAFGSERYFQLMSTRPETGPYLALGDRVTVVIDGQAYAIGPEGGVAAQARSLAGTPETAQAGETGGGTAPATPPVCPGPAGAVLLVLLGVAAPAWARHRRQG